MKHFPFQQAPCESVIIQQLLKVIWKFLTEKYPKGFNRVKFILKDKNIEKPAHGTVFGKD